MLIDHCREHAVGMSFMGSLRTFECELTPALKQFAIAKLTREQLLAYPAGTERAERIHVVTARVEEIHANSKYVTLSGGRGFGYQSLLIATGSTSNGLPKHIPGRDFDGV